MQSIAVLWQITAFLERVGSLGIMFAGLSPILILCFNIIISFFHIPRIHLSWKKMSFSPSPLTQIYINDYFPLSQLSWGRSEFSDFSSFHRTFKHLQFILNPFAHLPQFQYLTKFLNIVRDLLNIYLLALTPFLFSGNS